MKLEKGKIYKAKHNRKGTFLMHITGEDKEFAYGIMKSDVVEGLTRYWDKGDNIVIRKDLCSFSELEMEDN